MKGKFTTQIMTRMALLIALNVLLTRVFSIRMPIGGVEGIRIGFGALPVVFAGVFMGPLAGGIVGAVGDLVGYFINPIGPFLPHFVLTSALRGIIPGLLVLLICKTRREIGILSLLIAVGATLVIVDIFMVPYFIESLFGLSRVVTVPPRIIQQAISIPLYTMVLITLSRIMEKTIAVTQGKETLHFSGKIW